MDKIINMLNEISEVSGNAKRPVLAEAMSDADFSWVVKQALDPAITFGVGKKTIKMIERALRIAAQPKSLSLAYVSSPMGFLLVN